MGLIYQIECLETGLVYIGQTTQTLKKRFADHKSKFKKGTNHTHSVYEVLKNGFAFASVVEIVDDDNKLCERERYFIQNNECVNYFDGSFDRKEYQTKYREANLEKLKEYDKNRPNKIERNEKSREKISCPCGGYYTKINKARHERKSKKHLDWLATQTQT